MSVWSSLSRPGRLSHQSESRNVNKLDLVFPLDKQSLKLHGAQVTSFLCSESIFLWPSTEILPTIWTWLANWNLATCRLKNILPPKTKKSLNRAFILPYFNYCNQVWHHCGKRNTAKIEKVNQRALRYIIKNKSASHQDLLRRIRLPSMETRRIQGMLLTISNCISDKVPSGIRDLITLHSCKDNCQHDYILSLPKINATKYGLISWRYFAAKKWNEPTKKWYWN